MILAIFYKKSHVKTGKPITLSNGRSEIHTDKIVLENVSGSVVFGSARNFPAAAKHGTTTPLLIKVSDIDCDPDFVPTSADDKRHLKALKERQRYRKLHPIARRCRK